MRDYKTTSDRDRETTSFIAACKVKMSFHCVQSWQPLTERQAAQDLSNDQQQTASRFQILENKDICIKTACCKEINFRYLSFGN